VDAARQCTAAHRVAAAHGNFSGLHSGRGSVQPLTTCLQGMASIGAQDHAALKRAAERYAATLDLTPSPARRSTESTPSDAPQTALVIPRDTASVSPPDADATSPARNTGQASSVGGRAPGTERDAARTPEGSGTAESPVSDAAHGNGAVAGGSSGGISQQTTPQSRTQPGSGEASLQTRGGAGQLQAEPSEPRGQLPVGGELEGPMMDDAQPEEQEAAEAAGTVGISAAVQEKTAAGMLPAPDSAAGSSPSRLAVAAAVVKSTTLNMRKLSASE